MKGSATRILAYLEGADKRFVIPVYQRKYSWKEENCVQLFEDLKKVIRYKQDSHFFGSLVSSGALCGSTMEYYIIDGQQRLTTVTLLLLAIRNMILEGKIQPKKKSLGDEINERFLVSKWAEEEDKIKLRPVDSDRSALRKLFSADEQEYEPFSQLTLNYRYFCRELQKGEVTADELFEAVSKLEIISISLEQGDNAQLIFESLNSTGLALEEGDKIRNYVLMGLSPSEQSNYYRKYWTKIEKCTRNDVSGFVRDYLSIKQQKTPNISRVYMTFKAYAQEEEESGRTMENLLEDMLRYARLYEKLLTCSSGLKNKQLDDCLFRMKQLEIVVTRPFLMEVLRLNEDGKISTDDVLKVFLIVESYLFRRNICEVPTNALNKIFVSLNREILRYDNTADRYVDKLVFALRSKRDSSRFPDDEEFAQALSNKQIYRMSGKYKAYLFERFENYGTVESKDVYTHLDNNVYTIEHIMPQHLTPAWRESLGPDAEEIHETWQHRLANLTLTGYNPSLSNKSFQEKRDAEKGGYRNSGLRMNQKISQKESWGLPELEERNEEMISRAKVIWNLPETVYLPPVKEYESCTLDDENIDLTNRKIIRYNYQDAEQPVNSWLEMFINVVAFLHKKDRSVLSELAYDKGNGMDLGSYVSTSESDLHSPVKIDEQIYVETKTSTPMKLSILRRLFERYGEDPMDLVFYLRDERAADSDSDPDSDKGCDSCTLDDENVDLTNRKIIRYSYQNVEQPVKNWAEMFSNVVTFLHKKDRSVLSDLAYGKGNGMDLGSYVSTNESDFRNPIKIDEQIYVETNTSTASKLSILRRLFKLYGEDPMDLVFYLQNEKVPVSSKSPTPDRYRIRKEYWTYALPIIRDKDTSGGTFKNVNPTTNNELYGTIRKSGFQMCCVANADEARVEVYLNKADPAENKKTFDMLYSHRQEIETKLGVTLTWRRLDNQKASRLGYIMEDISVYKEDDWKRMAEFHAEWNDKICNVVLPYLLTEKKTKID